MIHEKLRAIRKNKGFPQEHMAKILHTDTSNYCRKERGETKIQDTEWEKLAKALDVPVEEIKEKVGFGIHNENSTFHDNSGNYNQYYNITNSLIENLQDYINLLKEENKSLKEEIIFLKCLE